MSSDLNSVTIQLVAVFGSGESEHNWEKIDSGIKSFVDAALQCQDHESIVNSIRKCSEVLLGAVSQ